MLFPHSITANEHTILWFRDPSNFEYLIESTDLLNTRHGLIDPNTYSNLNIELVGIESPSPQAIHEGGLLKVRVWTQTPFDRHLLNSGRVNPETIPDGAVKVRNIRPGLSTPGYFEPDRA